MVGEDLSSETKSNASGVVLVAAPGTGLESLTKLFSNSSNGLDACGLAVAKLADRVSPNAANPTEIVDYLPPGEEFVRREVTHLAYCGEKEDASYKRQPASEEFRRIEFSPIDRHRIFQRQDTIDCVLPEITEKRRSTTMPASAS